jgi:hypothetical protein
MGEIHMWLDKKIIINQLCFNHAMYIYFEFLLYIHV